MNARTQLQYFHCSCPRKKSVILILALMQLAFGQPVSGVDFEGQLLLIFKQSVTEDPEQAFNDWNEADQTPCNWNGISCVQSQVVSLSLPGGKLVGSIPSALGSLLHLRHINLHSNQLNGVLPSGLFNASSLQSLILFGNNFSGTLPQEIGQLMLLQSLDLSENAFVGSIPVTLQSCTRLKWLSFNNNRFSGSIPTGIGLKLSSLRHLDFSSNYLSGAIPPDLGNLLSLRGTLNLSYNSLSGSIPTSLGNLPIAVSLDLSNNNLSGPIPHNGALAKQNPAAFFGNPGLCGAPLQNPCVSTSLIPPLLSPHISNAPLPKSPPASSAMPLLQVNRVLSRGIIAAIAIGDAAGICLVCLVFMYCYWRNTRKKNSKESSSSAEQNPNSKAWLCATGIKDATDENLEPGELVALDSDISFNLDELLRASAYVMGKSGMGIVYRVILADGRTFAVRRLGDGGTQRVKEFESEVEAIGRIRHSNIVSLRAYYWAVDEKLLIYDFIPNGNLASALHGHAPASSEPLFWSSRLRIAKGVARGLAYLHECSPRKYVHGDIRPGNILLDINMEPYIADFGLNRIVNIACNNVSVYPYLNWRNSGSSSTEVILANRKSLYYAPEAVKGCRPTQKWDVYSYGIILLELLTGKSQAAQLAAFDMDLAHWIPKALEEMRPLPQIVDPVLIDEMHRAEEMLALMKVALACTSSMSDERPSMKHVAEMFNNINAMF